MPIRQQYYTSYVNKISGSAGFQVKAMSPGISADEQELIAHMIAYRVPPTANEYALESHPIALRYYYKDARSSILVCSQSNGKDENGRPGNFFAHSLVVPPDIFTSIPPIFFWKNSFWRKSDPSTHSELPTLEELDTDPVLDIEQVWPFLQAERHQQYFYALTCAVVHMERTQRRIVIIDTDEHVALWIAAISCLLPPDYRPLLSFATYHHDPYQAQFMITGTTPDSQFRATQDEYLSYFILNAQTGEVSSVEDSEYARLVTSVMNEDYYNDVLLPFFAEYAPRFTATSIGEQLDLMARYYRLRSRDVASPFDAVDLQAIGAVLDHFAHSEQLTSDDTEELNQLGKRLSQAYITRQGPLSDTISKIYRRFMSLLSQKRIPNEELLLQELQQVTRLVLNGHMDEKLYAPGRRQTAVDELIKTYGQNEIQNILNQPTYLRWLGRQADSANAQQLERLWQGFGSYLQPLPACAPFLQRSLYIASELSRQRFLQDLNELLQVIRSAISPQAEAWLSLAVEIKSDPARQQTQYIDEGLKALYHLLVSRELDLQARGPLRVLLWKVYKKEIFAYELQADLLGHQISESLAILEKWNKYARSYKLPITAGHVVESGLDYIRVSNSLTPERWRELIPSILASDMAETLSESYEKRLVDDMISHLSLRQFSDQHLALYRKYSTLSSLSEEARTILAGLVAMADGRLDNKLVERLSKYFASLNSTEAYQVEVDAFLQALFSFPFERRTHNLMIYATFTYEQQIAFWNVYHEHLRMLINSSSEARSEAKKAIDILSFWFDAGPRNMPISYICQHFFCLLPATLETAQQYPMQPFISLAHREAWYPLLKDYLVQRKMIAVAGQAVASQFQKLMSFRIGSKQKTGQQADSYLQDIQELFHEKKLIREHMEHVVTLYEMSRDHFWPAYWGCFMDAILRLPAEQSLHLLDFWFDQSFEHFRTIPAISQEFFLGLSPVLRSMASDHHFQKALRQIQNKGYKQSHWYPLIGDVFLSMEK